MIIKWNTELKQLPKDHPFWAHPFWVGIPDYAPHPNWIDTVLATDEKEVAARWILSGWSVGYSTNDNFDWLT